MKEINMKEGRMRSDTKNKQPTKQERRAEKGDKSATGTITPAKRYDIYG